MFLEAFPDMRITLDDVIGEGEKVATRGHWVGTHKGAFMGVPATGKAVNVKFMDMWRFENGKAVENWVQMDLLSLMQQLGVVPGQAELGPDRPPTPRRECDRSPCGARRLRRCAAGGRRSAPRGS